jgi:hypothetical protein
VNQNGDGGAPSGSYRRGRLDFIERESPDEQFGG